MLLLTTAPSPSCWGLAKSLFTTCLGLLKLELWPAEEDLDMLLLRLEMKQWKGTLFLLTGKEWNRKEEFIGISLCPPLFLSLSMFLSVRGFLCCLSLTNDFLVRMFWRKEERECGLAADDSHSRKRNCWGLDWEEREMEEGSPSCLWAHHTWWWCHSHVIMTSHLQHSIT